jgi:hypothetical protein
MVERAQHMFISTESWIAYLKVICGREIPTIWLPIPSSTERVAQTKSPNLKAKKFPFRIGHFGTFSPLITNLLEDVLLRVLEAFDNVEIYLIGRGSHAFLDRLFKSHTIDSNRISATGDVPIHELRDELSSCDLMIQPYPREHPPQFRYGRGAVRCADRNAQRGIHGKVLGRIRGGRFVGNHGCGEVS